jgi:GNAT superfamily N-acetyltransferase
MVFLAQLEIGNLQKRWENMRKPKVLYDDFDQSKDEDMKTAAKELLNHLESHENPISDMLEEFFIQRMEMKDLPEVATIAASSASTSWTKKMFAGEMKNSFSHCFVGRTEGASTGHVVGFICFRAIQDESELLNLCVHPWYRGRSMGKRLMQFYIDFCIRRGIKRFIWTFMFRMNVRPPSGHSYKPSGTRKNLEQLMPLMQGENYNWNIGRLEYWVQMKRISLPSFHYSTST